MANYSTVAEVDAYAISVGDIDWINSDVKETTALVNNVGGYSASATSIVFDGLTPVSGIEQYDVLKIGSEYLRVDAVTYATTATGTLTVTRAFYGSTAASIADDASISVRNQRKAQSLDRATDDIVSLHGQHIAPDELWLEGEENLEEAEKRQALWVNRYYEERESSQRIGQLTSGAYSDGAISIDPRTRPGIDPRAAAIIRYVMQLNEVSGNAFKRG